MSSWSLSVRARSSSPSSLMSETRCCAGHRRRARTVVGSAAPGLEPRLRRRELVVEVALVLLELVRARAQLLALLAHERDELLLVSGRRLPRLPERHDFSTYNIPSCKNTCEKYGAASQIF